MLGKDEVREIARKYSDEVRKTLNPIKIILFGSHINGNPNEWSDIDVAVLVNDVKDEDWYDTWTLLAKLARKAGCIEVEPHLMNPEHDPSGFVEHVIKTGEVVYQA